MSKYNKAIQSIFEDKTNNADLVERRNAEIEKDKEERKVRHKLMVEIAKKFQKMAWSYKKGIGLFDYEKAKNW